MTQTRRPLYARRYRLILVAGWGALMLAVVLAASLVERQRLGAEFAAESAGLHRLVSQRADQHDAHLTALSAIATAEARSRPDLFLGVAATIRRFYPRIAAVDLVDLQAPDSYVSTRSALSPAQRALVRDAALASKGQLVLRAVPGAASYLLVKRSPNTEAARFGLALEIDGAALLESDAAFWARPSVLRALALPDGRVLAGAAPGAQVRFDKTLGSLSQPLRLQAGMTLGAADLLPARRLAALAVLATLAYASAVLGIGQMVRARRAERAARLSAQEARLAHASRVNTLGEMASGMAHELTQPLTAILAQAQAGRHLCRRGEPAALEPVLLTIADQAKRAAAILERLRTWTRPPRDAGRRCRIGEAVTNVQMLLSPEAGRRGIALSVQADQPLQDVLGDPVELEQILFNLVRNAIEATADIPSGHVRVSAQSEGAEAVIEVADNGPGIPPALRDRVFEPFVSGKPEGTGLGLALCRRLAERRGGTVTLLDNRAGTVFQLRLPHADFQSGAP